jgi:hypothetical protein
VFCSRPAYCQQCQLWCQCYYVLHYYIMIVVVANSQWLFECCTSTYGFSSTRNSISFHSTLLNNVISKKQNNCLWIVITSNSKQVNVKLVYLHQIFRLLSSFVVPHFLLLLNSSPASDKVRQGVTFRQQRSSEKRRQGDKHNCKQRSVHSHTQHYCVREHSFSSHQ